MNLNSNCLVGKKCPKCNSQGPFKFATVCVMEWTDDGTGYDESAEMSDTGFGFCIECGYAGGVSEFDAEKNYIATGGTNCPYCNHDQLEGGPFTGDNGLAWQEMHCNNCGAEWKDVYTLTGIEDFPDYDFIDKNNEKGE